MGHAESPPDAPPLDAHHAADFSKPLDLAQALALGDRLSEIGRADRKRALRLARRFAAAAGRFRDDAVLGVARRARAHALRGLHRYGPALRDYQAALSAFERARKPLERARTAIGMIDVLTHLGRDEEAIGLAADARRVFLRMGEERRASRLDVNLANLHLRRDRPVRAMARYRAAERVFARRGDTMDLALTRFNMANLLTEIGRLRDALPHFESSAALWATRGSESAKAQCRLAHGAALARLGRYDEASRLLEAAQREADALEEPMLQGMAAVARGRIALDLGRWVAAGPLFDRAIERFERAAPLWEQAEAHVLRARWHGRAARTDAAMADLEEAARRFERIGQRSLAAWTRLERLRLLHLPPLATDVRARARAAVRHFDKAGQRVFEAEARLWLAEDAAARGDASVSRQLDRVRAILRRHPDPWLEQRWALVSARAARDEQVAMERLERAAAIADLLRARIPTETLRASFSVDQAEVAEQAIERLSASDASAERAFLWSERAHVPRLRVAAAPDPRVARLESALELRVELDRLDARPARDPGRRSAVVARLQQIYERLQIETSRQARQSRLGPAEVARLRRALAADETLIEYFVGRRAIHVFVMGGKRLSHRRLDAAPETLHQCVFRLRRLWDRYALEGEAGTERRDALRATEDELLATLSRALLEPALALHPSEGPLTVVPHGWLRDLPFHALPASGRPLGERRETTYLLSARDRLYGEMVQPPASGAALVAGIASAEAPTAEREAREVAECLPHAWLLCGAEARRKVFRDRWGGARLIHVASHGVRDVEEPRLSGIGLSDGRWTAFDVLEAGTRARLVVLSGCRTGDAVVWGGDEAFGLLPALVQSGARAVLVSLWSVGDEAARSWMRLFYEALASGRSPMRAWMHASGRIRAERGSAYTWAPFALYGRPSPSEALS
ncbi:MAG TPA: CHAT domain-containing protein [Candidatus Eisenbacteria bacterium]|nr:CHAT domain-containing protein [Candidatus Eisenbacteria bacterium]